MPNSHPAIYGIPGLGTDTRIFSKLTLPGFQGINWIDPLPKESITSYATRMAQNIRDPNPILIGVSFGGIIAQEIAALIPVQKLIVISTIKSSSELPMRLRVMRKVPLYQLSRGQWRTQTLPYWGRFFGVKETAELQLIQDMFRKHSDVYRMWAIRALLDWQEQPQSGEKVHIHGTLDRVFPVNRIQHFIPVEGGDHFMVYRKASEVQKVIERHL